jgi:hypothetical protein
MRSPADQRCGHPARIVPCRPRAGVCATL